MGTKKIWQNNKVLQEIETKILNGSLKNNIPATIINTVDICFNILKVDASISFLTVVFNLSVIA